MANARFAPSNSSVNIDNECLDRLDLIVHRPDVPVADLVSFIRKGSLIKVIRNWSFASSVNDHKKFIDVSVNLSKVSNLINVLSGVYKEDVKHAPKREDMEAILETKPLILESYQEIIQNMKVVYRALSNMRPALTNPNLRLMCNLIQYDSSVSLGILESFDLSLAVLPKLLVPSKVELDNGIVETSKRHLSIRYNFIRFWIVFCSSIPCISRKDVLLNNYKINSNIWKHMHDVDSESTILEILDFVKEKILFEKGFKKSTKCKILNESFIFKLQQLFNRINQPGSQTALKITEFVDILTTDNKHGLVFDNDLLWDRELGGGVGVSVNSKSFKVHNKLLYTYLTTLKPWESYDQTQAAIKTLKSCPELVPPYMNWIVQNGGGYHDPSLSSWWIGRTNFLLQVIALPIPEPVLKQYRNDYSKEKEKLSSPLIVENVTLAPLSRTSLIKCLNSDYPLIAQLGLQIIYTMLQKIEALLSSGILANKQELILLLANSIPDTSAIIQGYQNLKKLEKKEYDSGLVKLTLVMILDKYDKIFSYNTSTSASSKLVNETIIYVIDKGLEASSGIELIILDYCLTIQFQQRESSDLKWWNRTNKEQSLFTSLLKLSTSDRVNVSLSMKISILLETLISGHLIINDKLMCTPVQALLRSLSKFKNLDTNIWNLIDEAISRSMKQPYKYLDVSHKQYEDLSLFVIVMVEQLSFFLTNRANVDKNKLCNWFFTFARYLIVSGETSQVIHKLIEDYFYTDNNLRGLIEGGDYLRKLDFNVSQDYDEENFFNIVVDNSNMDLAKKWKSVEDRIPTSDLDFLGLIMRIKCILCDSSFKQIPILQSLVIKAFSYLSSVKTGEDRWSRYVFREAFWGSFFVMENKSSHKISKMIPPIIDTVVAVFEEAKPAVNDTYVWESSFNKFVFDCLRNDTVDGDTRNLFTSFLWVLNNNQALELMENFKGKDNNLFIHLFDLLSSRKVNLPLELVHEFIFMKTDAKFNSLKRNIIHHHLATADSKRLSEITKTLIGESIPNIENHYIIDVLLAVSKNDTRNVLSDIIKQSNNVGGNIEYCSIGHFLSGTFTAEEFCSEEFSEFYRKSALSALQLLEEGSSDSKSVWGIIISNVRTALSKKVFSGSELERLTRSTLDFSNKEWLRRSFSKDFVDLMSVVIKQNLEVEKSKEWIHKCLLYITKKFAESSTISDNFLAFLEEFKTLNYKLQDEGDTVWNYATESIMNTQLEVLLSSENWIKNITVVRYVSCIVTSAKRSKIFADRLLNILLSNRSMGLHNLPKTTNSELRLETAIILFVLYYMNVETNSSKSILEEISIIYLGSIRPEDLLLKSIMKTIESKISMSWVSWIASFELREDTINEDREVDEVAFLVEKQNNSLELSLSTQCILDTVSYGAHVPALPERLNHLSTKPDMKNIYNALQPLRSMRENSTSYKYEKTIYDSEFLSLLVVQIEELVKFEQSDNENSETLETVKFNTKRLIECHLLQFLAVCVSSNNSDAQSAAIKILCGLLKFLNNEKQGKDKNIIRVYISNLLNTIRIGTEPINSLTLILYSKLSNIIINPGHFLYKMAVQYVLSNSVIRRNELPLFRYLMKPKDSSSLVQNHYRSLTWLLQNLVYGLNTKDDLGVLRNTGFIEWALNLLNSPFIPPKVQFLVLRLVYNIQAIEGGYSLLISRFGILSYLEQYASMYKVSSSNEKDSWIREQVQLNIDQLMLRFAIGSQHNKRISSWACDQLPSHVKRLHT